ncbi:uncharacterized protein PRCAT00001663001 [Priceomyces carsonii]|uniref:uncharacterized protein n=1 Tax=Priceomyces carsonii TaxID=28549 RepID=UPI002ED7D5D2|nr:unnamed protein product [Priceomyces carsonii]
MGRLVGLELYNFKSYKGKCSIGFGSSFFTSIIGPNGAGKSNMMDAISFVLGVKSSHLRSQNLKDLIYRGRKVTEASGGTSQTAQDPVKAHVMLTYEKDNGELLELKRTISNSGGSEYKINDKSITSLHYSKILKSENILIKARNFLVFQGDVEHIASQSPKDLTKLIETVSGSCEYAQEYEALKEEYEKAHEYTISMFSRKRILNSESKQYKEQLVEQKEFEELLTRRSELIKSLNLYKIFHNEKKHQSLIEQLRDKEAEIKNMQNVLSEKEMIHSKLMAEYSRKILAIGKEKQEIGNLAKEVDSAKRDLVPLEANKKIIISKISSTKRKIEQLKLEISKQEKIVKGIEKELNVAQSMFQEFKDKFSSNNSSPLSIEAQNEYEELRDLYMSSEGSHLEEEIALLVNEKGSMISTINSYRNQNSNTLSRISDLEAEVNTELKLKKSDIETSIMDILALKLERVEARSNLIKAKEEINFKEMQLNTQLRNTLVSLDELSSQQRESNKQRKLRENISMLRKLFPANSIKGLVYELVRPKKLKYETALLTVLGKNYDAIIVETTSVAYKCIEILKERRSGVATFIPLDSIVGESLNLNYLRSIHELTQPAIDILEYDDKSLEQAIQYVVGDSLVTENIDVARHLKWDSNQKLSNKIVTFDGNIIHRSGLMTGGQQHEKPNGVFSWDKNELKKQLELKEDLLLKIANLNEKKPKEMEISFLSDEINELEAKLPSLRSTQAQIIRTISDREKEIAFQRSTLSDIDKKIRDKQEFLNATEMNIKNLEAKIRATKKGIYEDFCAKYGFQNGIEDYEDMHGESLRFRSKELSQYSKAISMLENKLRFEKERLDSSRNEKLELLLESYEEQLVELDYDRNNLLSKVDALGASLEISQEELKRSEENIAEQLRVTKSMEAEKSDATEELKELNKSLTRSEEALLKIDAERASLLKFCKIQNVEIPLIDGFLDSVSLGDHSDKIGSEVYRIQIDYGMMDDKLKESFSLRTEAELEAEIQTTADQLEKLTPNAKATVRLKEAEVRLKQFDRDHTRARQTERKVSDKYQGVRSKRIALFMEAFNHISGKIDSIYKELTKATSTPLGGSAYLTLEDEDSPYSSGIKYHAMPPMKRFRDMDLLSGGEKTVAALALLFAIHSFRPSPFFVLDEVDAALDNSNVAKIANYIKKNAGANFQFIVISLKNSLFEKSDALVGIYREQRENSSRTVTLDLRDYSDEDVSMKSPITAR